MANGSNTPINIGLNLQGNALGSVDELTKRMITLRNAAKEVGDNLSLIDKNIKALEGKNAKSPSNQTLKNLRQQIDLLSTSPDVLMQRYYQNLNRSNQASQINQLVNSNRQFSNPNTMNSILQQFDPKVVKQALEIRKTAADLSGDIKKVKAAEQALIQYKNTLKQLNTEFKGLAFIRQQQDASIQQLMSLPAGTAALQNNINGRNLNQFATGAKESAINKYMQNPNKLAPSSQNFATATPEQIRKEMQANASKVAATQRLMGQLYLQDPAKNPAISQQLNQYSQVLAKLEEERTKLQAIGTLRRANLRTTDEEIKKLQTSNDIIKNNQRLEALTKGNLNVKTLSAERIAQLSPTDLIARQETMTKRLAQAKAVMHKADELGNRKAQQESAKLVEAYRKELEMIKARTQAERDKNKPNALVERYNQMSTGESSGALLGIQGLLMRNYMIWGAFMGSITGSYAFLRDFELALKQTQAISQATDTQMEGLKASILEVGENSRFTAVEITEAATTLAQAGFSLAEIQKTLESVTLLATATGSSLKETVDIATASLGAFKLSADNMPRIVNQITQAMNLSKLDIQKFQLAVQYAGNAASDAGLNFEELLASVSTVANAGVRSGSTLGTGFRQLLTDLISPSQKFEKILTRLGLTTSDIDVRTNGLVGSLKKLKEAGFTTSDAYESFEVRSVAFYTALANNIDTYDNLTANLDNNTAAMDANEIQMNSLGAQTDRMFNQFKALSEVAGGGLRDSLTDLFHIIGDVTTILIDAANNGVVRFTIQAVAMGAALGGATILVRGMVGAVAGLIATMRVAGMTFALTNPMIFAISTAIAGAVIGFRMLTKATEDTKKAVEDSKTSLNNLKDSATSLSGSISEVTNKLTSLESRFENIKDDPAALAVEMSNLRTKAMELGVTLETDLTGSIESVKKGWQELRIELGKELEMNLDRQVSELRNLSALTAQMRSDEAQRNKPTSLNSANKNGYGLIYKSDDLKTQAGAKPKLTGDDATDFFTLMGAFNNEATSLDVFREAAKIGGKGSPTGEQLNAMLESLSNDLESPQSSDVILKKAPEWTKKANQMLTALNKARDAYLKAANNTTLSVEARNNAKVSAKSVTNLAKTVQDIQTYLNSISTPLVQAEALENQAAAQGYQNTINTQLMNGTLKTGSKTNWGKALSVADPTKAKQVSSANVRFMRDELMPYIQEAAVATGLPVEYIIAHMAQESGFSRDKGLLGKNADGSTTSAIGLMQVTKGAAKDVGADYNTISKDYRANIMAGAKYLKKMVDSSDGTLYSGSRAYFMGPGDWRNEKKTGRGQRTAEANTYAQGIFSTAQAVQRGSFGQVITQHNAMPEQLNKNVTAMASLTSLHEEVKAQLATLPKDVKDMNEQQKARYKDLIAQEKAVATAMSDTSSAVNNSLRAARSDQDQLRKERTEELNLRSEQLQTQIALVQSEMKDSFNPEEDNDLKGFNAKQGKLFNQLKSLQQEQVKNKAELEVLQATEYANNSTDYSVSKTVAAIAEERLNRELATIDKDIEQKRKAQLKASSKAFSDLIKKQNSEFVDEMKEALKQLDEPFQDALKTNEFNQVTSTWALEDQLGLTDMRNRRAGMDDPRFKDQFTNIEREDLDLAIQRQAATVDEVNMNFTKAELDVTLEQVQKIQAKIAEQQIKLEDFQSQQAKLLADNLTGQELESAKIDLDKQMRKLKSEMFGSRDDILKLQQRARELQNKLDSASPDLPADKYNIADAAKSIARRSVRNDQSTAGQERDLETTIGGINSAFHNLINTAIEASDNVDDFFKIITGGSGKSREAFKAFGYEIISTLAKVVQDRMVNKFVSMMVDFIFGGAKQSSSAALSGQLMGQGGSVNNGSGWWQQGLGMLIQTGIGAVAGYFGGGGASAVAQAGAQSSGATTYALGAQAAPIVSRPVVSNTGGYIPMAQGGEVVGGVPNTDSVPIMSMPGEYYLPKTTTSVVGREFLSKLKDDPHGMMNALKGNNLMSRPVVQKKVESNIYLVAPSAVPSTVGPNDIVTAVADNVSRNGELKQLIKRVAAE